MTNETAKIIKIGILSKMSHYDTSKLSLIVTKCKAIKF